MQKFYCNECKNLITDHIYMANDLAFCCDSHRENYLKNNLNNCNLDYISKLNNIYKCNSAYNNEINYIYTPLPLYNNEKSNIYKPNSYEDSNIYKPNSYEDSNKTRRCIPLKNYKYTRMCNFMIIIKILYVYIKIF